MELLPKGYKQPKPMGGNYMRLEDGPNRFRILSPAIVGYEYWTADNKPIRLREYPKSVLADIRPDSKIKHFWAMIVWNYAAEAVQILELTQSTIQTAINDLVIIDEWGDPSAYDITVTRKGEGLDTEYTVQPSPHKPVAGLVTSAFEAKKINLDMLFDGGNPFEEADHVQAERDLDHIVGGGEPVKMPPRPKGAGGE